MRTIIALCVAAGIAWGQLPIELMKRKPFDYYVDSVNGSDSNAGRSRGSAWKTIAKWADRTQRTGEKTCLVRGSSWREQMTVTASNVTVAACGAGAKPLLDASDTIAAEAWTKTDGRTNVYQATVAIVGGSSWVGAWQDGARMVRATSAANCDSTANSYYPSSDTENGNITLYVHASDGSDPATSGKLYEYTARPHGFTSYKVSGSVVRGISARRNLHNDGSLVFGRDSRVYDSSATDGGKHNILVRANSYLESVTAQDRYYTPLADALIVAYEPTLTGTETVEFVNCAVTNTAYNAEADGFYGHGSSGQFAQLTYTNCSASKCRRGWNIDDNTSALHVLAGISATDNAAGVRAGIATVTISDSSMSGNSNYNIWSAGAGGVFTLSGLITSGKNVIFSSAANVEVTLTNSTIGSSEFIIYLVGASPIVVANGNTYGAVSQQWYALSGATPSLTSDYNAFDTPASRGNYAFDISGTYYSWAAYRAATGQDAHSTPAP